MTTAARSFTPKPDAIYLGDNGCALCGAHLGMTAMYTGRDISGQKLHRVTSLEARTVDWPIQCEGHTPDAKRCKKVAV